MGRRHSITEQPIAFRYCDHQIIEEKSSAGSCPYFNHDNSEASHNRIFFTLLLKTLDSYWDAVLTSSYSVVSHHPNAVEVKLITQLGSS